MKNADGTVVKKTAGQLAQTPRVALGKRVVLPTFNGFNGGGGGLVYVGQPRRGWRIVSATER